MRLLFHSKLTKRYLVVTLIVIFVTLSFLYWLTIQVMNASFQSQIEYRDDLITRTLSKRINFTFTKMVNDMRLFSPYILKSSVNDRQFYVSEMQRMVGLEPLYLSIQAFDSMGKDLVRIPESDFQKQLHLTDIQDILSWSKTYYISNAMALPNGTKTIAVAYPAVDAQGTYKGGMVAFINLEILSEYLRELNIGNEGKNLITDTNGVIVAHSDKNLIGSSLNNNVLNDYLHKERYGSWIGKLFNEEMIVSYKPLFMGGFGLIVAEPLKQANQPSRHVSFLLFEGFILVLLVAIILTVFGTLRVVKPILRLTKQANEYKENKRKSFDIVKTNDELEDLSMVMGQMAKELTEKERRLFYILESIPYGVITTDNYGKITTYNKGAEELTLFDRDEAVGQYIFDLPLKENKQQFLSWQTLQEGKEFNDAESYIFDKEKKKHDVRLYSSLFRGDDQNILGSIIVMRDVSEMKILEEYVKQKERLASLGELTAGIAHEIKNPLCIIQAAAEAIHLELKESNLDTDIIHEFTQDILESSERMNRLLTDFLLLSKAEEEENKGFVDIVAILDELLQLLRIQLNDSAIRVNRSDEADKAWVYGNRNRLIQVYLNIILNSMQAMDGGGTLSVRLGELEHDWMVEIEDTGIGIPSTKIQRIFNPFYSTKQEGTGLGLSISHEIIAQHDGKIWVTSTESKGAIFFVMLPKAAGGSHV